MTAKRSSKKQASADDKLIVQRVQTGVRMEKRLVKILEALAEYHDLTLGDLLEGIVLHAFEGQSPFSRESLDLIVDLKRMYRFDLDATASHRLSDADGEQGSR